jgi:beta-glucosidase
MLPVEERVADLLSRMSLEEKRAELRSGLVALASSGDGVAARQRDAAAPSRLGIPVLLHADGQASAWPSPIALASSWEPELLRELYDVVAEQASARGARLVLGPSLDLARDPRLGRIEAGFGADAYLAGAMGAATIRGLQGARPRPVLAAVTGFAGPASPRPGSDVDPVPVSERELREAYLPPFEVALREGDAAAVVVARNAIDAIPSHANPWLLRTVLRDEWGFRGAVLGDVGAVAELKDVYRVAASIEDAAALALASGIDAGLDGGARADHAETTRARPIDAARLDAAVASLLRLKFRAGLFEDAGVTPPPDGRRLEGLSLRAAQRSITLLKNNALLPFSPPAQARLAIAVIEPADLGLAVELRARLAPQAEVLDAPNGDAIARARFVVLAADDVARAELRLEELKRAGKLVALVMVGDRPAMSVALAEGAAALVAAWGLGDRCAKAVAAVLSGEINPGGKLPLTLARNPGQWPIYHDVKPSSRRGYLFDTTEPLFPFGWGIGYSAFELGAPRLSATSIDATGAIKVAVDVRNAGQREGDETVQLYVRDKVASVARPVKRLKGFERVRLGPGETRTVTFTLAAESLAVWDESMRRVVEPGEFEVMTGPDSAHLRSATLAVRAPPP